MSGVMDSTGAVSGILGTTVGTPASPIIQVAYGQFGTYQSDATTSTTFSRVVRSGTYHWTGQITNVLASSYVHISMSIGWYLYRNGTSQAGGFGMFREDTAIFTPDESAIYFWSNDTGNHTYKGQCNIDFEDTSPATGTNNYYLGYRADAGSTCVIMTDGSSAHGPFTCTMTEIAV